MSHEVNGYYLRSDQTRQTRAVEEYSDSLTRPQNKEHLERLAQAVFSSLRLCGHDTLRDLRSCNPLVCKRIAEAYGGIHGLESTDFDFAVDREDHDQFITELIHLSPGGIRTASQLIQDGLAVSAKHPCNDYATILLAVLRFHGIPCRYAHILNTKTRGHTAVTELMIKNQSMMVRLSMQYSHKVWDGVVEDNMVIPDDPVALVLRDKDCWGVGMDLRKASLLLYFGYDLDCHDIKNLAVVDPLR